MYRFKRLTAERLDCENSGREGSAGRSDFLNSPRDSPEFSNKVAFGRNVSLLRSTPARVHVHHGRPLSVAAVPDSVVPDFRVPRYKCIRLVRTRTTRDDDAPSSVVRSLARSLGSRSGPSVFLFRHLFGD